LVFISVTSNRGFGKNKEFKKRLKGTNVVTIIGARNVRINSQESVNKYILEAGGRLNCNVSFTDQHNNTLSADSILYWMLTGKKEKNMEFSPSLELVLTI
jgi:hypothetical protein